MNDSKTLPSETGFLKSWLVSALKYGRTLTPRQMERCSANLERAVKEDPSLAGPVR